MNTEFKTNLISDIVCVNEYGQVCRCIDMTLIDIQAKLDGFVK